MHIRPMLCFCYLRLFLSPPSLYGVLRMISHIRIFCSSSSMPRPRRPHDPIMLHTHLHSLRDTFTSTGIENIAEI